MVKFRIAAASTALACGLIMLAPVQAQTVAAGGGSRGGGGGGVASPGPRAVLDAGRPQRRFNRPRPGPDYGPRAVVDRRVPNRAGSRGLLDLPGSVGLLDLPGGYRAERPRRPRRDGDGDGLGWDYYGYGDGSGVQEPIGYRDYGYFDQQRDGRARGAGGGFDYDRGYPYDHYSESGGDGWSGADYADAAPVTRCRVTWTRDRKSREQVPVRICSR